MSDIYVEIYVGIGGRYTSRNNARVVASCLDRPHNSAGVYLADLLDSSPDEASLELLFKIRFVSTQYRDHHALCLLVDTLRYPLLTTIFRLFWSDEHVLELLSVTSDPGAQIPASGFVPD